MYEAITRGVRVVVTPQFMDGESDPREGRYFWAYTIEITNLGSVTVKLMSRHWRITDATGTEQEVKGAGVVGEQPVLGPGESFSYTSGCPLSTPHGSMVGSYLFVSDLGESFEAAIPAFPLQSPHARVTLH
jgi:ApaG protein